MLQFSPVSDGLLTVKEERKPPCHVLSKAKRPDRLTMHNDLHACVRIMHTNILSLYPASKNAALNTFLSATQPLFVLLVSSTSSMGYTPRKNIEVPHFLVVEGFGLRDGHEIVL